MMACCLLAPNHHIDGLVQDCSNSVVNALELLQSCSEPSIWNNDLITNEASLNDNKEEFFQNSDGFVKKCFEILVAVILAV